MSLYTIETNPLEQTVKIFDSFYNNNLVVNSNQYDIVRGYFLSICDTKEMADNYTAILFRIAQEAKVDALTFLDAVKGTNQNLLELNKTFAYYLNSFKSKTSLYGIGIVPKPNQPVARNVVL
jgi:hypothetical protein